MKVTEIKLELGDLVKLRNGDVCIVLPDDDSSTGLSLFEANSNYFCIAHTSRYNNELINLYHGKEKDIMSVFKISQYKNSVICNTSANTYLRRFYKGDITSGNIKWDWEREEVKEMTVADIEKLVGTKVKIVKEV